MAGRQSWYISWSVTEHKVSLRGQEMIFCTSCSLRNWKSSFRNFCHSAPFGTDIFAETLVRLQSVSPCLVRVCDLRLASWYVSQTASSLVVLLAIWFSKKGIKCICVYSPNTVACWGLTIWMMADISSTVTEASLAAGERPGSGIPGKQPRRADLVPDISLPRSHKEGGPHWFSCLKKSSIIPSGRPNRDRNNLVMSAAFALVDPNLLAPFFRSTGGRLLKVYKLALGITSDKGLEQVQFCLSQTL